MFFKIKFIKCLVNLFGIIQETLESRSIHLRTSAFIKTWEILEFHRWDSQLGSPNLGSSKIIKPITKRALEHQFENQSKSSLIPWSSKIKIKSEIRGWYVRSHTFLSNYEWDFDFFNFWFSVGFIGLLRFDRLHFGAGRVISNHIK